jgi:hypothetical protein
MQRHAIAGLVLTLLAAQAHAETVAEPARQVLITHSADVVVIGGGNTGGLGGCMAAVAAARNGASVILVEQGGHIGLHTPMGLGVVIGIKNWRPGMDEGLFKEFAGYLARAGQWSYTPMTEEQLREKTEIIIRHHDVVSTAMLAMLKDAGVTTLFHTKFSGAVMEDGRIKAIVVESPQGRHAIVGKAFVDSTGLADVAASAGAPTLREEAFMGVQAFIGKVDTRKYNAWVEQNKDVTLDDSDKAWMEKQVGPFKDLKYPWDQWWPEYMQNGRTPNALFRAFRAAQEKGEFTLLHRRRDGVLAIAEGIKTTEDVAMPRTYVTGLDPTNVDDVSWVESTSRLALLEYHRVLVARVPGFENSVMERMADIVGLRGGRHIALEKQLTSAEIEGGGTNPDCIYISQRGKDRPIFEVPYRALLPQKVEGLLVVGKAAGAHITLRPANSILFQGQAAGTAAALAVKSGTTPRAVDIKQLQDALRANGVVVPAR